MALVASDADEDFAYSVAVVARRHGRTTSSANGRATGAGDVETV